VNYMQPINYQKAGKLMLTKYVNGALNRNGANSYFRNGAVQSIAPSVSFKTTSLADGNSDWDAAELDTGKEGSIDMTLSFMPIDLYAFLMGVSVEDLTNETFTEVDCELVIPSAAPYEIKFTDLPHNPLAEGTCIIVDTDAKPWEKATTETPNSKQYVVGTDKIIFNESDAGKQIFFTYDWTALTAKSFGLPKSGSRPAMECVVSGEAMGEDESTFYDTNTVIDRCKATGDIKPPEQGREPKPVTIKLKVLKPRGKNKAVDFKYAPRA
jgi:hypothetical protein